MNEDSDLQHMVTTESDRRYIKYHEARKWLKEPNFLRGLAHDFGRFYAESDWDDPQAAWNEFANDINNGRR